MTVFQQLTERQGFALRNPTDRSDWAVRPPPEGTTRADGKWRTILEVGRHSASPWLWMASISRQRAPGKPYVVRAWKAEWFEEADARLATLLEGVGDTPFDLAAYARESGLELDGMAGYHSWRELSEAEVLAMPSASTGES